MSCEHENFEARVGVQRLSKDEGGPITHYSAEISIVCTECKQAFEFIGLPIGSSPYRPMVGFDGSELRAPIMPMGQRPPEGLPSFGVRMASTEH